MDLSAVFTRTPEKTGKSSDGDTSGGSNGETQKDKRPSSLNRYDKIEDCNAGLFLNKRFSDVTFVIDNVEIPAHRLILAVRSSVFETMLYGDFSETDTQRITITDIGVTAFREMLRYMYTNNLIITDEIAVELLLAAHKYDLIYLEDLCSQYIKQTVNGSNVCLFFDVLKKLDAFKDITKMLLAYIESKWTIDCNIDFADISIDGLKYLVDHLSSQKSSKGFKGLHFEVDLFRRILIWARVNCEENGLPADGMNMRKALEGCEQLISFTAMTSDEFHFAINLSPDFFTMEEIGSIFTELKFRPIEIATWDGLKLQNRSKFSKHSKHENSIQHSSTTGTTPNVTFKFDIPHIPSPLPTTTTATSPTFNLNFSGIPSSFGAIP